MALLRYPYTNLHELNLDWIIEQLGKDGPVLSVNEKTGMVTLTGEDINRSANNPETVAAALTSQGQSIQTVRTQIGVTPLPTVAQTLTGAIAENAQEIANVEDNVIGSTELPTEAQTLTGAIAENADNIGGNAESITNINNKIGTTALPTTAQTLTGATAENTNNITTLTTQVKGLVERQILDTTGMFDGTTKETQLTITLKPNYNAFIIGVTPNNYNSAHYVNYYSQPNVSGVFYIEHALNANATAITVSVLYIPV